MELFKEDIWSDSDEEDSQNETPPKGVDKELSKNVLNTKHKLYEETVLKRDKNDDSAQDNKLIDTYLDHIRKVYVLAVISQNGKKNTKNLDEFPDGARDAVQHTLDWLEGFFNKNQIPDTIPYVDYIRNHFHVYPFVQNNSFMENE